MNRLAMTIKKPLDLKNYTKLIFGVNYGLMATVILYYLFAGSFPQTFLIKSAGIISIVFAVLAGKILSDRHSKLKGLKASKKRSCGKYWIDISFNCLC